MSSKVMVLIVLLCVTGIGVFWREDISLYFPPQDERPCACDKCLSEDGLLSQNFSNFAEPFLSVNYNVSYDDFNWWRHLQNGKGNYSYYKTILDKIFQMLPASLDVEPPSSDRCRTCAVVGNSVNMKNSHYGPLIDFQDIVIRMNRGRIKGFEADVGTRTTHHVMYPESAVHLDNTTRLVLFTFKMSDLDWIMKAISVGFSGKSYQPNIRANKDLVMVLNPAFMRYVHDVWLHKKGYYPSTGFMALVLALHICDEVHVFGFGADIDGNWNHYWDEFRYKTLKTGAHPGDEEYGLLQKLAQHQIVKFYMGRDSSLNI
ncbi:CMP-N-acetylneuraminate-beta-galactosamide-alpha-2,3-sialyltransferase 1-like [Anoplopoma fimbria]|uniref:CMP-N-acetylneuraminate-beta-galactosamide- alpha-2,3-sialyltransferase 1-like n=1 Tax=Anoplopoma fimbria TaxID=229290 RepID=UPI0023ECC3FE|nr:CMP-N-acetylneuraminate-beta-galactosamide-alpha-2,3-sialyltransferase 1-like [Anoplopoma fimbria]